MKSNKIAVVSAAVFTLMLATADISEFADSVEYSGGSKEEKPLALAGGTRTKPTKTNGYSIGQWLGLS